MEKVRKPMTEEALQKLAMAREKANAKRKEMAAERSKQKEQLVQEKLKEKQEKMNKSAEIEAKKRMPLYIKEPMHTNQVLWNRDGPGRIDSIRLFDCSNKFYANFRSQCHRERVTEIFSSWPRMKKG